MVFVNGWGPIPNPDFGFPDTCTTPVGPVPVPIPYPNFGIPFLAIPTQFRVLNWCMPAFNMLTTKIISLGDQPGVLLGVASGMFMGPIRHLFGSTNVFIGGPPTTKMLSPCGHNGGSPNIPGLTLAPAQPTIISLR
jgi:hypothetical protein